MKRWLTATTLSLCLGLVAVTGYLLLFPVSAFAAGGTADCGYGIQVTCTSSYTCVCETGVGCTRFDYRGHTGVLTLCPKPKEPVTISPGGETVAE